MCTTYRGRPPPRSVNFCRGSTSYFAASLSSVFRALFWVLCRYTVWILARFSCFSREFEPPVLMSIFVWQPVPPDFARSDDATCQCSQPRKGVCWALRFRRPFVCSPWQQQLLYFACERVSLFGRAYLIGIFARLLYADGGGASFEPSWHATCNCVFPVCVASREALT